MRTTIKLASLALSASLALFACTSEVKQPSHTEPVKEEVKTEEIKTVFVPKINADSAFYYVKKQVDFGPRVPGTAAHRQCGDFLVKELKSFGPNAPEVTEQQSTAQTFDKHTIPIRNIIASFYPEKKHRILLAAHWDTRPFAEMDSKQKNKPIDGANDGASGVGVLMEIARQLAIYEPNYGIDIIFFDAEDWGDSTGRVEDSYCLGSQYWAQNPHKSDYFPKYGILLDMVGDKNGKFAIEENSWRFAGNIVDKVWNSAYRLGFGDIFINTRRGAIIDDHYYVMKHRNIPMIDIINYDPDGISSFGHTWHTQDDNLDNIGIHTLEAVAKTVIKVVYEEGHTH